MKQLRTRVKEIECLRNEEEEHCLAVMTKNGNHGERHSYKAIGGQAKETDKGIPRVNGEGKEQSRGGIAISYLLYPHKDSWTILISMNIFGRASHTRLS